MAIDAARARLVESHGTPYGVEEARARWGVLVAAAEAGRITLVSRAHDCAALVPLSYLSEPLPSLPAWPLTAGRAKLGDLVHAAAGRDATPQVLTRHRRPVAALIAADLLGEPPSDRRAAAESPLTLKDYQRLFLILEDVAGAPSLPVLCAKLREALARHLAWTNCQVCEVPTGPAGLRLPAEAGSGWQRDNPFNLAAALATWRADGVVVLGDLLRRMRPAERRRVERFLAAREIKEAVATFLPVDGRLVVLSAAFTERTAVGPRERTIMRKLGRQLAPLVAASPPEPVGGWGLTEREREVAVLVAAGMPNREIAAQLHVAVDTVKKHLTHVLEKTGCETRTQFALRWHAVGG